MARNFIQPGETITLPAPRALASGDGFNVGAIVAVALAAAAQGAPVEGRRVGVFDIAKAGGQAWTPGQKVYWDATNNVATTTAGGNILIGATVQAQASAATIGRVLLTGQIAA